MQVYDHTNFTPQLIPGHYNSRVKEMVRIAVAVGWKAGITGSNLRLIAPHPHKKVISFLRSGDVDKYASKRCIIMDLANPLLVPVEETAEYHKSRLAFSERRAEALMEQSLEVEEQLDEVGVPPGGITTDPNDVVLRSSGATIVDERPMVSRKGRGKGYLSGIATERHWSNGDVDYACTVDGCEFTSHNRLSMGPHKKVHKDDTVIPYDRDQTVDIGPYEPAYTKDGYSPRRDRVAALAAILAGLLAEGATPEEVAEAALGWLHDQSDSGSHLSAEREDLTSDQVLDRIRSMLDNGLYLRQQDEIAAVRAERDAMEVRAASAQQVAERARETLQTFRELFDEVDA